MTPGHNDTPGTNLPRGVLIVLSFAAATVTVAGLKAGATIIAPILLAIVLVITAYPMRRWLSRRGLPGWLASTITILGVYLVLVLMTAALMVSAGRLASLIADYAPQIDILVARVGTWLGERGVGADPVRMVVQSLDAGRLVALATAIVSTTLGAIVNLVLIAALVLFIVFDSSAFCRRLLAADDEHPAVVSALRSFAHGTRRYFTVSAGFGLVVAAIDTAVLAALGVPAPLVWGALAFVTNFVPNIGFVIGLVPPAIIGLLAGGVGTMVAVIVAYCVINMVIQSVIQPRIVGNEVGLSATVTFAALLFWSWVFGPLGAVLAIPVMLLVKALLIDVDPAARWLEPLLCGNSVRHPPSPPGAHD